MRLPVSKAYRAFAELDRFSDAQCAAFSRSARPRGWRLLAQAVMILLAVVLGLGAMIGASFLIMERFFGNARYDGPVFYLVMLPTMAATLGMGPLLGYMIRDFFLRRGIRRVLVSRGSCHGCRYTITGLVVDGEGKVKCPECGAHTIADPELGEIVDDEKGGRIFLPSPEAAEAAWPVFFTRARVMRWVKRVAVTAAVVVIAAVAFVGWWEWSVRRQAAAAQAARDLNAFVEYSMSRQPAGADGESENGFDVLTRVTADLQAKAGALMPRDPLSTWPIDISSILDPTQNESWRSPIDERRRLLFRGMDAMRNAGAFEPMKQLLGVRRAVQDPLPMSGRAVAAWSPLIQSIVPSTTQNLARLKVASMRDDLDEYAAAAEAQLAIARLCAAGSTVDVVEAGERARAAVFSVLAREIATRRDVKWLDAIEALVARQQRDEHPTALLDVRRLMLRDYVCVFFSDPANFRFGRWSPVLRQAARGYHPMRYRLGHFDENLRAIEGWYERNAQEARNPEANRSEIVRGAYDPTPLLLPNLLGGLDGRNLRLTADAMLYREGLRAVIAIERHRLETGDWPLRLEDLVPERLATLPRDPWSGGVLKYRLEVQGSDPAGCGYVLYSVGVDGADGGGEVPKDPKHWWVYVYGSPDYSAQDVVISP